MIVHNPLIGTWRLVSQHVEYPDGRIIPARGDNPVGVLMYDAHGNMAAQLMRTDAHAADYTDLTQLSTAMAGYMAYFGTYEIDEAQRVVRHTVIGSAYPGFIGTVQVRQYEFSGDQLILRAPSPGDDGTRVIVWERV